MSHEIAVRCTAAKEHYAEAGRRRLAYIHSRDVRRRIRCYDEYAGDLTCVSAADGKPLWKRKTGGYDRFSIGADFLVTRGYGGHGIKVRLEDGKDYPGCRELGGETHACGAVALTPNYSFAITLAGLNVREVQTGKLLWRSPGFAPRACVNPALANGRVFWTSGANGMVYCWEPVAEAIAAFTGLRREYRGSWIDCVAAERLEKLQPPPLYDEP